MKTSKIFALLALTILSLAATTSHAQDPYYYNDPYNYQTYEDHSYSYQRDMAPIFQQGGATIVGTTTFTVDANGGISEVGLQNHTDANGNKTGVQTLYSGGYQTNFNNGVCTGMWDYATGQEVGCP